MKWQLTDRRRRPIGAGTVVQMYEYLKSHVPDGEYKLVGSDHCCAALSRTNGLSCGFGGFHRCGSEPAPKRLGP